MAATSTQQIINNGPRNLVLKYTIGGTTGDTTSGTLVDISAIDSTIGDDGLRLEKVDWVLTGFSCKLAWDGGPDVDLAELTSGGGSLDFSEIGGIVNNATDQSGDILFTTTGYQAGGEGGHIVLHLKKRARIGFAGAGLGGDIEVGGDSLTISTTTATTVRSNSPAAGSITLSGAAPDDVTVA